jgi:multiple sugar transport system ATP-binding protein
MSDITLSSITKEFEDLTAVSDVDLTVTDGELLVLVGPSGCGKTTLLRMIAGLETPTSGDLFLGGDRVNSVEPADRDVAMVFQNYALYPHMSAKRNMTFGATSSSTLTAGEVENRVEAVSEMLGIPDLLDRKPGELSGGEKQRVAMGRALLRDPEVLLLDEPLSNLDAKLRDQMREELARLQDEVETPTVYVTHDQTEAMTLGDRIAVLSSGRIQQIARPQDLYDHPNTRFVAQFIGSPQMNVVPATITETSDTLYVETEASTFKLRDALGVSELHSSASNVELGIRPEDLYLADRSVVDSNPFEASITMLEPRGDAVLASATVGNAEVKFKTETRPEFSQGDTVRLQADLDRLHVFDADTGESLYHSDPDKNSAEQATPL